MAMTETSLERSLSLLREQGLRAIDLHSSDGYRRVLFSHVDFLELYLKARLKFTHGMRTSRVTGPAFLGYESNVLYKIIASIEELMRKAIQFRDPRITAVTGYALTQALTKTIDLDAHPVFVKLLDLIKLSLALAMNIEDSSKRKQAIEVLASALENFGSYNLVATHLDEAPKRLESLPRYGQALVASLNGILKEAVDRADIEVFSIAFDTLAAIIQEGYRDRVGNLYVLELRLKRGQFSQSDRSELESQARHLREEVDFFQAVSEAKTELIYNLGGWTVKRYSEEKLTQDHTQTFMSRIFPYFSDFTELTKLHLKHFTQDSDSYGWGLLEAVPGAFQASKGWMTQFYVIAALRILKGALTDEVQERVYRTIENQTIPSSSLESAAAEIKGIGDSISADVPKWRILVPDLEEHMALSEEQANRFDTLNNFWDELVSLRRQDEEQKLLDASISEDTRTQFAEELRKNWFDYSTFKKLAKAYGFFEDHTHDENVPDEVKPWGLSPRLEDKMWFVEENPFASKSIAESLGRGLGESETKHAFDAIASILEPVAANEPHQASFSLFAVLISSPSCTIPFSSKTFVEPNPNYPRLTSSECIAASPLLRSGE